MKGGNQDDDESSSVHIWCKENFDISWCGFYVAIGKLEMLELTGGGGGGGGGRGPAGAAPLSR